jgi:hypothetical protein
MLTNSHAGVRFVVACTHLPLLERPRKFFEGVVDFEGDRSGSKDPLGCPCVDAIVGE